MQALEPIKFEYEGEGLDVKDEELSLTFSQWDSTSIFILDEVVGKLCEKVDSNRLRKQQTDALEAELEPLLQHAPEFLDHPMMLQMSLFATTSVYFFHKNDTVVLPHPRYQGVLFILSDNKNEARELRDSVVDGINEAINRYDRLGLDEIELYEQDDYTQNLIQSLDRVKSVERDDPDEFEKEVHDELKPISQAFLQNLIVDFEGEPNREYDLLFALDPDAIHHVAVKDYSGTESNHSKEDIITSPRSSASLLGSETTLSVVKGIDEDVFSSVEAETNLREDVEICNKPECREIMRNTIFDSLQSIDGVVRQMVNN